MAIPLAGHNALWVKSCLDAETGLAEVNVKNKFGVGDTIEVISPEGNLTLQLEHMEDMKGHNMDIVLGGGHQVRIKLPQGQHYHQSLLALNLNQQAA